MYTKKKMYSEEQNRQLQMRTREIYFIDDAAHSSTIDTWNGFSVKLLAKRRHFPVQNTRGPVEMSACTRRKMELIQKQVN